jgi:hypothetical protein
MVPAEKATRKKRMRWRVSSLKERAKMPLREKRLTNPVAKRITS